MRTIVFSPGGMAGAGLALFILYIVSMVEGFEFSGWTRIIIGGIGILLWGSGAIWNYRLRGKNERAN